MEGSRTADLFIALSRIVSRAKSIDDICSDIAALVANSLGYKRCSIILERGDGDFMVAAAFRQDEVKILDSLFEKCTGASVPLMKSVLENKTTVTVDSLPEGIGLPPTETKAVLSPLTCKGKGAGILISEADSIGEPDITIMDGISTFVSIGIENHVLNKEAVETRVELIHELETFQLMYEIGREILSNHKTDSIVETVIQMMRRVIPCDGVAAASFDRAAGAFKVNTSWGTGLDRGQEIGKGDTPFFSVMESGRPFYQHDITLDFKEYPRLQEWSAEKNVFSYFCLPLNVREDSWGVLVLSSMRPVWFRKAHIATAEKIATHVGIALENAMLLSNIEEMFLGIVKSLVAAIDAKSKWTKGHSLRVAEYSLRFAEKLGFDRNERERLQLAALLHDIGKIGTFEAVLDKQGTLTAEERQMIRKHPAQGADILSPLKALSDLIPAVRHHHERYDGTGYPDGLAGDDIPHQARILALADSYDAMMSDRPYRESLSLAATLAELTKGAGTQFDPALVDLFIETILK